MGYFVDIVHAIVQIGALRPANGMIGGAAVEDGTVTDVIFEIGNDPVHVIGHGLPGARHTGHRPASRYKGRSNSLTDCAASAEKQKSVRIFFHKP